MSKGEPGWTIAELSERVSAALAVVEYEPPANGQVRAVPDLRTIRYYTTLGLLDRPTAMKGRTALYGRRHLLQLVAVKRLQAEGKSLSEVQAALTGLDDGALAKIAVLPETPSLEAPPPTPPAPSGSVEPAADADATEAEAEPERREGPFWAARPARAAQGETPVDGRGALAAAAGGRLAQGETPVDGRGAPVDGRGASLAPSLTMMAKIDLAPGVSLVIERAGQPGLLSQLARTIDAVELARAAAPLLEALRRHGLARPDHEEEEPG